MSASDTETNESHENCKALNSRAKESRSDEIVREIDLRATKLRSKRRKPLMPFYIFHPDFLS